MELIRDFYLLLTLLKENLNFKRGNVNMVKAPLFKNRRTLPSNQNLKQENNLLIPMGWK